MTPALPYELHPQGSSAFVTFDVGERVALPLLSLSKAVLRGNSKQEIVLTFADTQVIIIGAMLDKIFEHLLVGRVKLIRPGEYSGCEVIGIQLLE